MDMDVKDVQMKGQFVGEETVNGEEFWLFEEYSEDKIVGRMPKKMLKGIPPMNEQGDLYFDTTYDFDLVDGKNQFAGGNSARLIQFKPVPF